MTEEKNREKLRKIKEFEQMDLSQLELKYGVLLEVISDSQIRVACEGEPVIWRIDPALGKFQALGGVFDFHMDKDGLIHHCTFLFFQTGRIESVCGSEVVIDGKAFTLKDGAGVFNYKTNARDELAVGKYIAYSVEPKMVGSTIVYARVDEESIEIKFRGHSIQRQFECDGGTNVKINVHENYFVIEQASPITGDEQILPDGAGGDRGITAKDWFDLSDGNQYTVLTTKILPPPGMKRIVRFRSNGERAHSCMTEFEGASYIMTLIPLGIEEHRCTYEMWWDKDDMYEEMNVEFDAVAKK